MSPQRFLVIDLRTQINPQRRFAVWDTTTQRFWKINGRQTWTCVEDLVEDFRECMPEVKFQETFIRQRNEIAEQAAILGFYRDED